MSVSALSPTATPSAALPDTQLKRKKIADGREQVFFPNGRIDVSNFEEDDESQVEGVRIFPDETFEKGIFSWDRSTRTLDELEIGSREKDDQTTYVNPPLIQFAGFDCANTRVVYGYIEKSGGGRQRAVLQKTATPHEYILFKGTPLEALLAALADGHNYVEIDKALNDEDNPINPKEFLAAIQKPNRDGVPFIFTLHPENLIQVFFLSQEFNVPIDLTLIHPITQNTLFMQWVGKGHFSLTEWMLRSDPRVIRGVEKLTRPLFSEALLKSVGYEADMIIDAMKTAGIALREPDEWMRKAYKGDTHFSEEAFRSLPLQLRELLYSIANQFRRDAFVCRLNDLGMGADEIVLFPPQFIAHNMDCIAIGSKLGFHLQELRQQRRLLTSEEFSALDQSKIFDMKGRIDRHFGGNFIRETAAAHHCTRIKAPMDYVVFDTAEPIKCRVHRNQQVNIECPYSVRAERVIQVERSLSREEMAQLLTVLFAAGYSDIHRGNFIVAEDGVYIVDTEDSSFAGKPGLHIAGQHQVNALFAVMRPKDAADREWLLATIRERQESQAKRQHEIDAEWTHFDKRREAESAKFGFTHSRDFQFDIFAS